MPARYFIPLPRDRVSVNGTTYHADGDGLFTPQTDVDALEMARMGGVADGGAGPVVEWAVDALGNVTGQVAPSGVPYLTWTDLDFPIVIRTTGPNIPTLATVFGSYTAPQWQVSDVANMEGQEMPHSYKEGSPIYWHLHLITNGLEATAKYVKFQIDWAWASNGTAISAPIQTVAEFTIAANTPDRTMYFGTFGAVSIPALKIGSHIWPRLTRIAAAGAAPLADPFATILQIHYQQDTPGSNNIGTK
jgi:hypothetical protein